MTTIADLLIRSQDDEDRVLERAKQLAAKAVEAASPDIPKAMTRAISAAIGARDIPDLIFEGLQKSEEVIAACERTRNDPSAVEVEILRKYTVSTEVTATVVLLLNDFEVPNAELHFRATLAAHLDAIELLVQAGRVARVRAGTARCEAALFLKDERILAVRDITFELPELLDLTDHEAALAPL